VGFDAYTVDQQITAALTAQSNNTNVTDVYLADFAPWCTALGTPGASNDTLNAGRRTLELCDNCWCRQLRPCTVSVPYGVCISCMDVWAAAAPLTTHYSPFVDPCNMGIRAKCAEKAPLPIDAALAGVPAGPQQFIANLTDVVNATKAPAGRKLADTTTTPTPETTTDAPQDPTTSSSTTAPTPAPQPTTDSAPTSRKLAGAGATGPMERALVTGYPAFSVDNLISSALAAVAGSTNVTFVYETQFVLPCTALCRSHSIAQLVPGRRILELCDACFCRQNSICTLSLPYGVCQQCMDDWSACAPTTSNFRKAGDPLGIRGLCDTKKPVSLQEYEANPGTLNTSYISNLTAVAPAGRKMLRDA